MVVKKIAVLFSGTGSNLVAILEKLHGKTFGDTKIEFNGEPLSVRLTALADALTNYGKGELACYRRLKW